MSKSSAHLKAVTTAVTDIPFQPASLDIWEKKYRLTTKSGEVIDHSIDETYARVARALADVETDDKLKEVWEEKFLWAFGLGFLLVLVVGGLRQRLPWWPLHPVMFLIWATWPAAIFSHSFLLGWIIRSAMLRFAGHAAMRKARSFMIGVIAGDLLGGAVFMAAGAIYYGCTGNQPPPVRIFL